MTNFAPSAVITAWEDCHGRTHAEVAIRLLQVAYAGHTDSQLANLSVGQRDRLLLEVRRQLSGGVFHLFAACTRCAEEFELEATVEEFERPYASPDTYALTVDGYDVTFRLPTSSDVASVMLEPTTSARLAALWRRCVDCTVGGSPVDEGDVPDHVLQSVDEAMARLDQQAVVEVDLTCPSCGNQWSAGFDIVPVLWAEVNDLARRGLSEVHRLASAYGWSEDQVLALTPRRRRYYLEQL